MAALDEKTPIVVTGVAGFIGSHTAERLLERGETVIGIDEVNDYYDVKVKEQNVALLRKKGGSQFAFYRGDICDTTLLETIWRTHGKPRRQQYTYLWAISWWSGLKVVCWSMVSVRPL